jgi:hypothetical protein
MGNEFIFQLNDKVLGVFTPFPSQVLAGLLSLVYTEQKNSSMYIQQYIY